MVNSNCIQPLPTAGASNFSNGDKVFLAKGSYQGTLGTFLNFRPDPKWADVLEQNSQIREHPVEWLQLSAQN